MARFTGVDPISDQFPWVSTFNYAENEPVANIDLHGLQKYKPKMQRIEDLKDLLSSKMVNNIWEGTKTATREFFTKPVGKLMNNAGTVMEYGGIFISMAAPRVGAPVAGAGKILSISGQVIVAVDEAVSEGKLSIDSKIDLGFTVVMEVLPEPLEEGIDQLGLNKTTAGIFKAHRNAAVKATEELAKMGVKSIVTEKKEEIANKENDGN